jgi:CheY-like chemotaxis protein
VKSHTLSQQDVRSHPILYVDDEAANLRTFELAFRREFTILTAQSAEEGKRLLNENPVAVVLSDHKMPGMTGVDFLSWVRDFDEGVVRILMTAYGDGETLGSAINDGRIYRYVPKPWNPEELGPIVRRAIERYALDRERSVLLEDLGRLAGLTRALQEEDTPDGVLSCVAGIVHRDFGFDGVAALALSGDGERLRWVGNEPRDPVADELDAIALDRESAPLFFDGLEAGAWQTLRTDDVTGLERPLRSWIQAVSAEQLVVVPLEFRGTTVGAVAVDNRRGGMRFGADDRKLLDAVALQAAMAFEKTASVAAPLNAVEGCADADRYALLGQLWRGAARDFHESLEPVEGFLRGVPALPLWPGAELPDPAWRDAKDGLEALRQGVDVFLRAEASVSELPSPVALGTLAGDVKRMLAPEARARGVEIAWDVEAGLPKVLGNGLALQHAFAGLVLRAVQDSRAGTEVAVSVRHGGPDEPETAVIEVSDRCPTASATQLSLGLGELPAPAGGAGEPGLRYAARVAREHAGSLVERPWADGGRRCELRLPCEVDLPA